MAASETILHQPARRPLHPMHLALCAMLALAPALPAWAWHLPWHHRAHGAAAGTGTPGLRLMVDGSSGSAAAVPQSWDRNTLLVDLTRMAGTGSATLTPPPDQGWPVRLAFRVQPGSIASLEVAGAQRVLFTVPARGAALTLQLDPGVYVVKTSSLRLRWSAVDDLPH